jgi:hypothetical protein
MKTPIFLLTVCLLAASAFSQDSTRRFSNAEGKTLDDRIVKYEYEEQMVVLEKNGRIPLDTFSAEDQEYILLWNQVEGFMSTMRFKMSVTKGSWASMKHEQTVTPYYMDAIQIPGKKTPNHHVVMIEDYEEYNAVYLEAEGYEITLRNQNFFPIENIVVESKVFFEQELYTTPDSLFLASESEYNDVVTSNKIRFLSETIPIIVPREDVVMQSECAIIVDHQVERSALVTTSTEEGDEGDEEMDEEEEPTVTVEGFGEWDDHGRRRKGKVTGVWFRVGIKDTHGEMVWREITEPTSLAKKVSWEDPTKAADPSAE